jgi:group I intron endonuclease
MKKDYRTFTRTTGIYSITCLPNNKKYIGKSKDIADRWKQHLYQLKRKEHHCKPLQEAYDEYGYTEFVFKVELICSKKKLDEKENEIWDKYEDNFNNRPKKKEEVDEE